MERIPKVEGLVAAFHILEGRLGVEQRSLGVLRNLGVRYRSLGVGVEDHILVERHKLGVVHLESTDIDNPLGKQELCC